MHASKIIYSRSKQDIESSKLEASFLGLESAVLDDPVAVGGHAGEGVGHAGLAAEGGAEGGQADHLLGAAQGEEGAAGVTLKK